MLKKIRNVYDKYKDPILLFSGTLIVSLIVLPYLLLGKGSYVYVHDQMDCEIMNYIYQAKYLLVGERIPEFMNGMFKASMLPPAPLGVLFYKVFEPFTAFALMHWICLLTAFAGTYLLSSKMSLRKEVGVATAVVFSYMPFGPVYGLAIFGQPLLIYCFWKLLEDKEPEKHRISTVRYLLGIAFYAGMSSLALIGYVWVVLGCVVTVALLVMRKPREAKRTGIGTGVLTVVYLLTNIDLLSSLVGESFATHRQEMALSATADLAGEIKQLLLYGGPHAPAYSAGILVAGLLFLILYLLTNKNRDGRTDTANTAECNPYLRMKTCVRMILLMFSVIVVFLILAVLWNSSIIVNLRKAIGGMVAYFQADRIYWTFPFLWMMVLAWVLEGLLTWGDCVRMVPGKIAIRSFAQSAKKGIAYGICAVLLLAAGLPALRDNTLNKNFRLVLFEDYEQVTWESFYMEDVFEEIDQVIGADKEKFSVVSLGMYPSIALYNGYTCADGYSNNYALEYKHKFRKVIARELEKNPEGKSYFDDWGNRVYMLAQPYGNNAMVAKGQGVSYEAPEYDVEAMKELNIGYIFSAAPIAFSEEYLDSFELLGNFSDEDSYFEIYVYKVL